MSRPDALAETEIALGENTYHVRPTLRIVRRLEQIDAPLAIARALIAGQIGYTAMARILEAMLRDIKDAPKRDAIEEALFEQGLDDMVKPVSDFMANLWMGNRRATEEAERRAAIEAGDPPPTSH